MAEQGIPVIGPIMNKLIGTRNERFVRKYTARVDSINALEDETRELTDAQLREKLGEFRQRLDAGTKVEDLMVEAFAVAREAMDRAVGIRNILNPEKGFDASKLPAEARAMWEKAKAEAEALEDAEATGEFRGSAEPVPGWRRVEIPVELYEAVKALYPESRPPFRARPFDVQLIGAMVLYQSKIAEMKTGEGKTIVAPLASYLAAVERWKVHVVTVNDYLVQRDRDWVFPFFHALGLTVGAIHPQHMQSEDVKREMYLCDVVYGTTSEFGFDYLRDNMKRSVDQQVQRRREFAIVDEVDSILIDEARTPLIISGQAHDDQPRYEMADGLARHLVDKQAPWQEREDTVDACRKRIKGIEGDIRNARDKEKVPALQKKLEEAKGELPGLEVERDKHTQYYEIMMERKQVHLNHEGIAEAQRKAGLGSFYVDENMDIPHLLENALRAHVIYSRDKDYVVMNVPDRATGRADESVVIVDTFTGRPMIGRQWSDGLHQAVECKERVVIKPETQTIATITIQNFFKMYKRLSGMTGTADTEAQEFHDIYSLDVVSIPTNKPMIRSDFDDLMYLTGKDKWEAIVDEIKRMHDVGRPILVGTTSVEKSEMLSSLLTRKHQIAHEVLNAKQHEREAHIVVGAGQLGAVMIATNMAGRGTDIVLGKFTREQLLEHWLRRSLAPRTLTVEASDDELREAVYRKIASQELDDIRKRDAEEMDFAELEIKLLRQWAELHTWMSPKKIEAAGTEELMTALDESGRFLLHRVRWFDGIEDLGGLHVIGTERHESRRIDNQLRGRSGRQGDKGSSRFFVALDDDLMKMFAGETTMKILSRLGMKEGDAIEHPMLSKSVERAQKKVEERNFQIRKNILEYDEVMEHQRQAFYGIRQRVLEGRDVKGLVFEYIEDSIDDACQMYLDKEYAAQCAAEHAKQVLDCSIMPERLRGKDREEMERVIRRDALDDMVAMISVTLGEYMPIEGSEVSVDFDSAGLINWAKNRFGVELNAAELREGGAEERRHVQDMLERAAAEKVERADLSGVDEFLASHYGAKELASWFEGKFGIKVSVEAIVEAEKDEASSAGEVLREKVEELYKKREEEYPVEYAMDMTTLLMRQNPQVAAEQLARWAKRRFDLTWTGETIRTTPPQEVRRQLLAKSREVLESGQLEQEIDAAIACETDDELETHLRSRFDVGLPHWMRFQKTEEDRKDAIRGRIESVLRAELLQFEQTILLETLDQAWKDHLYEMDQLRESIGFRAFSQRDPRIEYKREGSRLFQQMFQTIRDRVSDLIFKVRLAPQGMGGPPRPAPARMAPPAAAVAAPAQQMMMANAAGMNISGPGLPMPSAVPQPAAAPAPAPKPAPEPVAEVEEAPEPGDPQAQLEAARAARAADRGKRRRR
jgi:preprotein translocase subunit SecA